MLKILKNILLYEGAPETQEVDLRRRHFFKEILLQAAEALRQTARENISTRKYLRPPGAVEELTFLTICTRCDECIKACPHEAIRGAEPETGLALGSPIIIPREKPCYLCEDFPCIRSCKGGALLMPSRREEVRMGLAVINKERCIAGGFINCQSCVIACPIPGAVSMPVVSEANLVEGKPVVNKETCTGCGLCEQACLTVNTAGAIRIIPT